MVVPSIVPSKFPRSSTTNSSPSLLAKPTRDPSSAPSSRHLHARCVRWASSSFVVSQTISCTNKVSLPPDQLSIAASIRAYIDCFKPLTVSQWLPKCVEPSELLGVAILDGAVVAGVIKIFPSLAYQALRKRPSDNNVNNLPSASLGDPSYRPSGPIGCVDDDLFNQI